MRLGNASPATSANGEPSSVRRRRRGRAHLRGVDRQLQREMRERMRDDSGYAAPIRAQRRMIERVVVVEVMRPLARRHFRHAAEQTFGRARAHEHATVGARHPESCAAPQPAFGLWRLARKGLLIAALSRKAGLVPGTERAGGLLRRADHGAEVHHGLCVVTGALRGRERFRKAADRRLRGRQLLFDRKQARDHAFDIAVDRCCRLVERDRGNRRRRVGADAGQGA